MAGEASARAPDAPRPLLPANAHGVAEAMPLIVWTATREGLVDYVNRRWLDYCGLPFDEAIAAGWPGLFVADDAEVVARWWQARLAGVDVPVELRLRRARDGAHRRHEISAQPLHDDSGALVAWLGSAADVEDQRAASDEVRRLSQVIEAQSSVASAGLDFDRVLELVADYILLLTPADGAGIAQRDGDEVRLRATRGTGRALEGMRLPMFGSLVGKCLRERQLGRTDDTRHAVEVHESTAQRVGARSLVIAPLVDGTEPELALVISSSRPAAFGELHGYTLQLLAAALGTAVANAARFAALAERQQAVEALRASELRHRTLIETMAEGVWQVDAHTRTTFVNSHMARMLGYQVHEMRGRRFLDFVDAESQSAALHHLERRQRGEASRYDLKLRCKNGDAIWVSKSGAPLLDADGRVTGSIAAIADISERRALEEQLRQQMQTYAAILAAQGQVGLGFAITDAKSCKFVHVSEALARIYGYRPDELLALDSYLALVPPEELDAARARIGRRHSPTERDLYEAVHIDKHGRRIHIELARLPIDDRHNVVLMRNIDERVHDREQLRRSAEALAGAARRLELMLSNVDSAVLLADGERVRFVNRAFEEMMGMTADEAIGRSRAEVIARVARNFDDPSTFLADAVMQAEQPVHRDARLELRRPRRRVLRCKARAVDLIDGPGQFVCFTDITAEADLARERDLQARTDALTGLYNRRGGEQSFEEALAEVRRSGQTASLLLADIDRFKQVNDTFGHEIGDRVIAAVARALGQTVRAGDVVARWGGEEILVLLPRATAADARQVAERCRAAVAACRVDEAPSLETSVSIGVAEVGDGEPLAAALQRADAALYRAKRAGRNRVAG